MANRMGDMGMDVQVNRRMNSKYDAETEKEVIDWMNKITGESVPLGRENVAGALKNGHILIKLINAVYAGTSQLPAAAQRKKHPFKFNTMTAPFKQMENIQIFLTAAEAYGVPRASLFQTVDLYEMRNMTQVLNCLLQLGTECQRNNFNGPVCGPKPTYENKREFTAEQLNASKTVIGLQAGSNKGASQSGMSMGATRHIADIKVDDMSADAKGVIGLQYGSNKGASQSGMSMGATRHIADLKVDEMSEAGKTSIGLLSGTNKGASQSGMSMGAVRHIADTRVGEMSAEGKSTIGLQAGSNQGATQSGMSMGGVRHIADIKVQDMSKEGASVIGLQAGSNLGASQAGMNFGAQRHIGDVKVGELE
ncbi:hypothetical protein AAHC03_05818 [Spirometra sp. Aus1]